MSEPFVAMLAGGHPNSLGRTVEVVETVLADPVRLDELMALYDQPDEVVRLRASNALKRIEAERHDLMAPRVEELFERLATLDQPSAQWTFAQLMLRLDDALTPPQRDHAWAVLFAWLRSPDWIVLNATMETLARWAASGTGDGHALRAELERLAGDARKSVAGRARKLLAKMA